MILDAFAKKNKDKIGFENNKEINTVGPLLSFYREGNDKNEYYQKNHYNIYFIIMYIMTHGMFDQKTTRN